MRTLSLEEVLKLHALVINETGGSLGVRDLGRLESAIASQTQNVFGQELYPAMTDKASAIIRGLALDHPFVDGNKRTAMLSGLTLLKMNNLSLNFTKGEIEKYAVEIATNRLSVSDISKWLNSHKVNDK